MGECTLGPWCSGHPIHAAGRSSMKTFWSTTGGAWRGTLASAAARGRLSAAGYPQEFVISFEDKVQISGVGSDTCNGERAPFCGRGPPGAHTPAVAAMQLHRSIADEPTNFDMICTTGGCGGGAPPLRG